jgi:staphyloferrin B biosynthesis citrate synthase
MVQLRATCWHSLEIGMAFRNRLRSGEWLIGGFVKTPTFHASEILGDPGYDFIAIDVEHAMLDRGASI